MFRSANESREHGDWVSFNGSHLQLAENQGQNALFFVEGKVLSDTATRAVSIRHHFKQLTFLDRR